MESFFFTIDIFSFMFKKIASGNVFDRSNSCIFLIKFFFNPQELGNCSEKEGPNSTLPVTDFGQVII